MMAPETQQAVLNEQLIKDYQRIRSFSDLIRKPLSNEDCIVQSMPDVSPTRWHLAHTTWFFEQFVLRTQENYRVFDEAFCFLFNSYYNTVGEQFPRAQRGLISRPGMNQVAEYRRYVDLHMQELLSDGPIDVELATVIAIGLNHEQQHQELMLTDIKHVLSRNPMFPKYQDVKLASAVSEAAELHAFEEGIYHVGFSGSGFSFDNEQPRHRVFCEPFQMVNRPVTCGEYLEFIEDGGYQRPDLWLSMGWQSVQDDKWSSPLYWQKLNGEWQVFTLAGLQELNPQHPVCHVSYFEADAFARWSGNRLPTEFEWEVASEHSPTTGEFADTLMEEGVAVHPVGGAEGRTMFGGVWEWTSSQYLAYPGYCPPDGALGEYNGKFMCNQFVLRGGSCATSSDHIRPTYRNFFPPETRWQFSGFRLAK